jgi:Ribbon-helix-helix protein, copG family
LSRITVCQKVFMVSSGGPGSVVVPKRSSLRDRLGQDEARGREAVYQPDPPAPALGPPQTVDRQRSTGASWDDTYQRVSFYCPLELLEAVEADMARSGRSKSAVIVAALREHLAQP